MSATRRLWARRVLRAGWAVAPVLAAPASGWRFLRQHFIGVTCWSLVLWAIVAFIHFAWFSEQEAAPEALTAAMKSHWCVKDLIPRRAREKEIFTNRDVANAKRDCAEAQEKYATRQKQLQAIEAAAK